MSYQCPLCHQTLTLNDRQWRCPQNHQFDNAKEGYVNLMPVQHKRSKQPGDSPEMMESRRRFLDAGHYQPLRDRVAQKLDEALPAEASTLLDIGCGEGYYTAEVARRLSQQRAIEVYGLDVAKVAIRNAAKRYREVNFCVASSHRLPFADQIEMARGRGDKRGRQVHVAQELIHQLLADFITAGARRRTNRHHPILHAAVLMNTLGHFLNNPRFQPAPASMNHAHAATVLTAKNQRQAVGAEHG